MPSKRYKTAKQLQSGVQIIKESATGSMRQLRCPKCHNLATARSNHQGQSRIICGHCGAQFGVQRM
jgi:ribosomal protein S27E